MAALPSDLLTVIAKEAAKGLSFMYDGADLLRAAREAEALQPRLAGLALACREALRASGVSTRVNVTCYSLRFCRKQGLADGDIRRDALIEGYAPAGALKAWLRARFATPEAWVEAHVPAGALPPGAAGGVIPRVLSRSPFLRHGDVHDVVAVTLKLCDAFGPPAALAAALRLREFDALIEARLCGRVCDARLRAIGALACGRGAPLATAVPAFLAPVEGASAGVLARAALLDVPADVAQSRLPPGVPPGPVERLRAHVLTGERPADPADLAACIAELRGVTDVVARFGLVGLRGVDVATRLRDCIAAFGALDMDLVGLRGDGPPADVRCRRTGIGILSGLPGGLVAEARKFLLHAWGTAPPAELAHEARGVLDRWTGIAGLLPADVDGVAFLLHEHVLEGCGEAACVASAVRRYAAFDAVDVDVHVERPGDATYLPRYVVCRRTGLWLLELPYADREAIWTALWGAPDGAARARAVLHRWNETLDGLADRGLAPEVCTGCGACRAYIVDGVGDLAFAMASCTCECESW